MNGKSSDEVQDATRHSTIRLMRPRPWFIWSDGTHDTQWTRTPTRPGQSCSARSTTHASPAIYQRTRQTINSKKLASFTQHKSRACCNSCLLLCTFNIFVARVPSDMHFYSVCHPPTYANVIYDNKKQSTQPNTVSRITLSTVHSQIWKWMFKIWGHHPLKHGLKTAYFRVVLQQHRELNTNIL